MNMCVLGFERSYFEFLDRLLSPVGPDLIHSPLFQESWYQEVKYLRPSLIILDVNLPGGVSGLDICSQLRNYPEFRSIPIVFLSDDQSLEKRLLAFQLGAVDYIDKKVHELELLVRLQCRVREPSESENVLNYGDLLVNMSNQTAFFSNNNHAKWQLLPLSFLEYRLLTFLIRNAERVITREEIFENIWGGGLANSSRTVDVHISVLRRRCSVINNYLHTVYGVGYVFSHSEQQTLRVKYSKKAQLRRSASVAPTPAIFCELCVGPRKEPLS